MKGKELLGVSLSRLLALLVAVAPLSRSLCCSCLFHPHRPCCLRLSCTSCSLDPVETLLGAVRSPLPVFLTVAKLVPWLIWSKSVYHRLFGLEVVYLILDSWSTDQEFDLLNLNLTKSDILICTSLQVVSICRRAVCP